MKLKGKYEGILFDLCTDIWQQIDKAPSVRFNAFKFIIKIARKYTDLSQEITYLMQDQYLDSLSPGVKKSISKMMMELTI